MEDDFSQNNAPPVRRSTGRRKIEIRYIDDKVWRGRRLRACLCVLICAFVCGDVCTESTSHYVQQEEGGNHEEGVACVHGVPHVMYLRRSLLILLSLLPRPTN